MLLAALFHVAGAHSGHMSPGHCLATADRGGTQLAGAMGAQQGKTFALWEAGTGAEMNETCKRPLSPAQEKVPTWK